MIMSNATEKIKAKDIRQKATGLQCQPLRE